MNILTWNNLVQDLNKQHIMQPSPPPPLLKLSEN